MSSSPAAGTIWPRVRLSDLLTPVSRPVAVSPATTYPLLGMHGSAQGLYLKEQRPGALIQSPVLYQVQAGDFVYSRLFAWKGSFGIAGEEVAGGYVSNEFPCFRVETSRLLPGFVRWYFAQQPVWSEIAQQSTGTTAISRNRFKEAALLALDLPLPPLVEQQRIVARVDELAGRIQEARGLKQETAHAARAFWKTLSQLARATASPPRSLADMAEFLDGRRIPLSEEERATRPGPYPYYGASGIIDWVDGYLFEEELLLLSEDGANLLNRSTPIAFIARGKYWVNNHAHVLRPYPDVADVRFLAYALADYDVSALSFASAQAKLNQSNARKIAFPLPPLAEQRRIVAYLDQLQAQAEELKRLQAESAAELEALLPAVLEQAFRGAL